jgi:hypothetical protein
MKISQKYIQLVRRKKGASIESSLFGLKEHQMPRIALRMFLSFLAELLAEVLRL